MLIVANWKAYVDSISTAQKLFAAAKKALSYKEVHIVLAPSSVYLGLLSKGNRSKVTFAAQDVSVASVGAATGELPAEILKGAGASYVIVGHSERRAKGEDNDRILEKVQQAISAGLTPILCVGEQERDDDGLYLNFVRTELHSVFSILSSKDRSKLIVAYEPIWAIGKSAAQAITPSDLNEMVRYIRKVLGEYLPESSVKKVPILYGGSVEPGNVKELIDAAPINGLLVGHASVEERTFKELVKNASAS